MNDDDYRAIAGAKQLVRYELVHHDPNNFSLIVDGMTRPQLEHILGEVIGIQQEQKKETK